MDEAAHVIQFMREMEEAMAEAWELGPVTWEATAGPEWGDDPAMYGEDFTEPTTEGSYRLVVDFDADSMLDAQLIASMATARLKNIGVAFDAKVQER